jgi:hypothetical protein
MVPEPWSGLAIAGGVCGDCADASRFGELRECDQRAGRALRLARAWGCRSAAVASRAGGEPTAMSFCGLRRRGGWAAGCAMRAAPFGHAFPHVSVGGFSIDSARLPRDRQTLLRASPREGSGAALDMRPLAASYGPQKGNTMSSRIRDRLKHLEDRITPQGACSCSSELRTQTFRPMPSSLRRSRPRTASGRTTTLVAVVFTLDA